MIPYSFALVRHLVVRSGQRLNQLHAIRMQAWRPACAMAHSSRRLSILSRVSLNKVTGHVMPLSNFS